MKGSIGVAVVGAGYWGPNLIRTFSLIPNVSLKYVVDISSGRLKYVEQNFPDIQTVSSLQPILDDPQVQVVAVATPISTHFEVASQCINRGKHVFVEKPITNSSGECEHLLDLAEKSGVKLGVGHIYTFNPAIQYVYDFIKSSPKFNPYYITTDRANLRPPKSSVNVIWDLAVHDFSIVNYLFGNFPISVHTFAEDFLGAGLLDMAIVNLRYPNNKRSMIHVSWHCSNKVRRFGLYGSNSSIFFDDTLEAKLTIFDEGVDSRIDADEDSDIEFGYRPGKILKPQIDNSEPLYEECRSFIDYVKNGGSYKNGGYEGLWVVKMCEAADKSVRTGKEVLFDE